MIRRGFPATLFVSLNIPGVEKVPPGAEALFLFAMAQIKKALPDSRLIVEASDALGPYAIFVLELPCEEVKRICVGIETALPSARLLDLDVYSSEGVQIDRKRLGLLSRGCLVCAQPAVECMRTKRHSYGDVLEIVHDLLSDYRS